jgi:tRNA(Ile2) C34 agmatinyltransferase TiaS
MPIRAYIGFDDTDRSDSDRGTGKLARWFHRELPEGCHIWGVVRQQLLVHEDIPYTSHNSSACVIVEMPEMGLLDDLASRAARHLECYALDGSDPGLCVTHEGDPALPQLIAFSRKCTSQVVSQQDALEATRAMHLSGHGGTCDGIIGAAAAVGLTAHGWSGRFIEYGDLRDLPETLPVSELSRLDILAVSLDRDGQVPAPADLVHTKGWLRPRLWGGRPILPVIPGENGVWESLGEKRRKNKAPVRPALVNA